VTQLGIERGIVVNGGKSKKQKLSIKITFNLYHTTTIIDNKK